MQRVSLKTISNTPLLLYSEKISQKNFLANFQSIRENFMRECLVLVDKDRAIALIHEMLYLAYLGNFLSQKFPTVRYFKSHNT